MNKPKDYIYDLIQKMDRNERRYFKLYIKNIGNKGEQYAPLFDAIAKQKEYDEGKLKQKFKTEAFVKNFALTKHRLYQLILKSLRSYHSSNTIELEILDRLKNIEILQAKGLFVSIEKELDELESLAQEYDTIFQWTIIIGWRMTLLNTNFQTNTSNFHQNLTTFYSVLDKLNTIAKYWELTTIDLPKNAFKGEEDIKAMVAAEQNKNNLRFMTSAKGILASLAYRRQNWSESLSYYNDLIELLEDKKYLKSHTLTHNYLATLFRAMSISSFVPLVDKFHEFSSKFNAIYPSLKKIGYESSYQFQFIVIQIRFNKTIGLVTEGKQSILELNKILEQFPKLKKSIEIPFVYGDIAIIYFLDATYNLALDSIRASFNRFKLHKNKDPFLLELLLLEIIIHYYSEAYSLVNNLVRAFIRQLDNNNSFYLFGKTIALLLKKLANAISHKEKETLLIEAKSDLIAIENHQQWLVYFPFLDWIDSLIENISLTKFLQTKYGV